MKSGVSLLLFLVSTEIWECWCKPWNIHATDLRNENEAWNRTGDLDLNNQTSTMNNWTNIFETTKTIAETTSENTTQRDKIALIPTPTEKQFPTLLFVMICGMIIFLVIICLCCCLIYLQRNRHKKVDSKGNKIIDSPTAANMKAKRMGRLQTPEGDLSDADAFDPDLDSYISVGEGKQSMNAVLSLGEKDTSVSQAIEFNDEYEVREISKDDEGRNAITLQSQPTDPCIQIPNTFPCVVQEKSSSSEEDK